MSSWEVGDYPFHKLYIRESQGNGLNNLWRQTQFLYLGQNGPQLQEQVWDECENLWESLLLDCFHSLITYLCKSIPPSWGAILHSSLEFSFHCPLIFLCKRLCVIAGHTRKKNPVYVFSFQLESEEDSGCQSKPLSAQDNSMPYKCILA